MSKPYGVLDTHISILVSGYDKLASNPKIKPKTVEKYSKFLYVVRENAKDITKISIDISKFKEPRKGKITAIIENILNSLREIISLLIEKIDSSIERGDAKSYNKSEEESFLSEMESRLRKTGNISKELLQRINSTKNEALDRYLVSILGSLEKSTKYPWVYYVPSVSDLKDRLQDVYLANETQDPNEIKQKYCHNFQILMKEIYYITKLNVRNISMLRMADINEASEKFKQYKDILLKLLFINVSSDFIVEDYSSLASTYSSHVNNLSKLLGGDNYKRLIYHIIEDGKSFPDSNGVPTKTVKTETLIKYIFLAVQKIEYINVEQFTKFYDSIVVLLDTVLTNNANISQLSAIVDLSDDGYNKTELALKHNRKNNVYTYVKIRADKVGSLVETNQRYKVGLDSNRQIMYMGYDPTPESIYNKDGVLRDSYRYLSNEEEPLPNNYLFGPFTYTFKPDDNNSVMANHESVSPLINKLKNGDSVCIIGYGSSGSGKTTTLVYAGFEETQDKRDGILIHFCNHLKQDYTGIEVSFVELEGNINEDISDHNSRGPVDNFKTLPIPPGEEDAVSENGNIKYTPEDKARQKYYNPQDFRINEDGNWVLVPNESNLLDSIGKTNFDDRLSLGKYIVTIMDNKRSIKATTNNPVSSRSHMIIFVKLKKKDSPSPYLVICDFAGVENRFQCDDPKVLEAFKHIRSATSCKDKKSPISLCKEFDYFYDVKDQIDELRKDPTVKYKPVPKNDLYISSDTSDKIVRDILTDKSQRDLFTPVVKPLLPYIEKVYIAKKEESFINIMKNELRDAIITPIYVEMQNNINSVLDNPDKTLKKAITKVWDNFGINFSRTELKGKKRERPQFIIDMDKINLRIDNFDTEYNKIKISNGYGRTVTDRQIDDLLSKLEVKTPLLDLVTAYCEKVFKRLDEINKVNEEIDSLNNKKGEMLQSISWHESSLLTQICHERLKEGLFINDSLATLRAFISHFVMDIQQKDGVVLNPKFIDECAPLQCNPNYEECLGGSISKDKNVNEASAIANKIRERLCCYDEHGELKEKCNPKNIRCKDFSDITFCIFNVINLSKKTNNPPPIPHIDITNLVTELNRLESVGLSVVEENNMISDDMTARYVHPIYLEEIKTSPLLGDYEGSLKGRDRELITIYIEKLEQFKTTPPSDINITINLLKTLITTINTTNSLSLIGTLEFTDMISKFGLNRTTCNYRFNRKESKEDKMKGVDRKNFVISIGEYKSFLLNLHKKYNEGIISR